MSKNVYPFRVPKFRVRLGVQSASIIRHADAGSAGVGHSGLDQKANVAKSSWLRAAEPDFATEWAVLGSNQ
jgi:hypothetical protein